MRAFCDCWRLADVYSKASGAIYWPTTGDQALVVMPQHQSRKKSDKTTRKTNYITAEEFAEFAVSSNVTQNIAPDKID